MRSTTRDRWFCVNTNVWTDFCVANIALPARLDRSLDGRTVSCQGPITIKSLLIAPSFCQLSFPSASQCVLHGE